MSFFSTNFMLFGLFFVIHSAICTSFVPVYMWSTKRSNEKVPALRKISQDTFKLMFEHLKHNDFIIVFAEHTLSPEDFAQHDQTDGPAFPYLAKLGKSSKVTYLPYVQSPVKALKNLGASVSEISVSSLSNTFLIPKTDILIIDMNDAEDSENRVDMLKRHDDLISDIYSKFEKSEKNILAVYTAHHESWVASEDISARKARSLQAMADEGINYFFNSSRLLLYLTMAQYTYSKTSEKKSAHNVSFTYSTTQVSEDEIQLDLSSAELNVSLAFTNGSSAGYWELNSTGTAFVAVDSELQTLSISSKAPLVAPRSFSYHCGDQTFLGENFTLLLKDFQVQLLFNDADNTSKFSDAYDCVGFTSVPIWSGIFVTAILLMILTFGITMMMDIRTMDRFDDAKGKTISINTAE